jgi:hypothetical protein
MTHERLTSRDPRIERAVRDLKALISARFPTAIYEVFERDDPDGTRLRATVDVEDPDAVLDVVMDRLYEFQVEQELPIYVIPVRPWARAPEKLAARAGRRRLPALPPRLPG